MHPCTPSQTARANSQVLPSNKNFILHAQNCNNPDNHCYLTAEPESPKHSQAAFTLTSLSGRESLILMKSFVTVCIVCQIDRT